MGKKVLVVFLVVAFLAATWFATPAGANPASSFPDYKTGQADPMPCWKGDSNGLVRLGGNARRVDIPHFIQNCINAGILAVGPNWSGYQGPSPVTPTPSGQREIAPVAPIPPATFWDRLSTAPWLLLLLLLLVLLLFAWLRSPRTVNRAGGKQVRFRRRPAPKPVLAKGWDRGGDDWYFPEDRMTVGQALGIAIALILAAIVLILLGTTIPVLGWLLLIGLLLGLGIGAWQSYQAEEVVEEGEERPFVLMYPNPAKRRVIPWSEVRFEDTPYGGEILPGTIFFKHGTRPNGEKKLIYTTVIQIPDGWLTRRSGFTVQELRDWLDAQHRNDSGWVNPIPSEGLRPTEAAAVTYDFRFGETEIPVQHIKINPPNLR